MMMDVLYSLSRWILGHLGGKVGRCVKGLSRYLGFTTSGSEEPSEGPPIWIKDPVTGEGSSVLNAGYMTCGGAFVCVCMYALR